MTISRPNGLKLSFHNAFSLHGLYKSTKNSTKSYVEADRLAWALLPRKIFQMISFVKTSKKKYELYVHSNNVEGDIGNILEQK